MELQELIIQIDAIQKEIDALRPLPADVEERVMQKFRLDWDFHSSKIEGNSLTYGETKTFLLHDRTAAGKPFRDHLELRGHHEAIQKLEAMVRENLALTETTIRHLHQTLLGDPYEIAAQTADGQPTHRTVTPGRYKVQPNNVETKTGDMFSFAAPVETPAKMRELMTWYETEIEHVEDHPLILAAILHYKFVCIHPFDDGNGRIARLLMNLVLMKHGYPPAIVRIEDKENYYRTLQQADVDELDTFVGYIGEQLLYSLDLFLRGAQGNNIEEVGDIDRKIVLFKTQLMNSDKDHLKKERSTEAISEIVANAIGPLMEIVQGKLATFDDMFFGHKIEIAATQPVDSTVRRSVEPVSIQDELLLLLDSCPTMERLWLEYTWEGFKFDGANAFPHTVRVEVDFYQFIYQVNVIKPNRQVRQILTKLYHQFLNDEECARIAAAAAEETLNAIQAQRSNR